MATERHKTSFAGVYWRESKTNGKKDKTFYITYKDENRKNIEVKVGRASEGCNITFAKDMRDTCIVKVKTGEEPPVKRRRKNVFTFDDAFQAYIKFAKGNKKSWKRDEGTYNYHLKDLHDKELKSLDQKTFNDLITEKRNYPYQESTIKSIITLAQQVINYAINNDYIKDYTNPLGKGRVQLKQPENQQTGFLSKEQAAEILKALKERPSKRMYNMTVLLLFTGARFSEVASLTWSDIDLENELITFKATKRGNKRSIKISPLVKQVLSSLVQQNTFLVIPSKNDKQITQMPKQWQSIVDKIIPNNKLKALSEEKIKELSDSEKSLRDKQAKERITIHSLRHTHATWLAKSGEFTLLEIKAQLGHKTTQMTERYAHHIPEDRHIKHSSVLDGFDE